MRVNSKGFWDKVKVVWPLLALLVVGGILFMERRGISLNETDAVKNGQEEEQAATPDVFQEMECLLIYQPQNPASCNMAEHMEVVLSGMKVGFIKEDVKNLDKIHLSNYKKIVYAITDLNEAGENIMDIADWVEAGGVFMNTAAFDNNYALNLLAGKMGIMEGGRTYGDVSGFEIIDGFMIGAEGREFLFDETMNFSLEVLLKPETKVYVQACDSDIPLLWSADYGQGKYIVLNLALTDKAGRGFLAAAYSLTDDISVYPVINASTFYLDDFPAPVPGGNGDYIREEYGLDIANFYSNVWWEDVLAFAEKYGIKYTGLIIEDYSDIVEEPFVRTSSVEKFSFYGNMLLNTGGELGFHGYNHMPLCMEGFDYMGLYDSYNLWKTKDDMKSALQELQQFSQELFPNETFTVYVPPSNILSEEGREVLIENWPELRAIAATYLPGECGYEQEFEVAEDGIVETPRITSGTMFDNYSYMMAFSELNFHFVQSHFMHPDDVLDEDRGAANGWSVMKESLNQYMEWIYESVPLIRNLNGSGMADAVEAYDGLSVQRTLTKDGIHIELGGFQGEAFLMVRINEGALKEVRGGSIDHITGNLYLLTAESASVDILVQ